MPTIKAKTLEEAELKLAEEVSRLDFWVDEFDGMNCNDYEDRNCLGWDGESRRCDCGNRRVSWSFSFLNETKDENGDFEWYAYGEAY